MSGAEVLKTIIEKGRFAQWLGILITGAVGIVGGLCGFLNGAEIVKIILAGVGLAGGVELMKQLKGSDV